MEPVYKERGGGWIGSFPWTLQATWPFASIQIFSNKLILKVGWRIAELNISDIVITKRILIIPFLADGVRIVHNNTKVPLVLIFWSFGKAAKIRDMVLGEAAEDQCCFIAICYQEIFCIHRYLGN